MLLQITEPTSEQKDEIAIGIDLGTTHSIVAIHRGHETTTIPIQGKNLTPSVVYYPHQRAPMVGWQALKELESIAEDQLIASSKRWMHDPLHVFDKVKKTPVDVAADILSFLKSGCESYLGFNVHKAVITVPAYFDEGARAATKKAAEMAGFDVLRLINEPTAAALAYGIDEGVEGLYVVYDLGGGTFDLSILNLTQGVFQVLATAGDTHLGGDDIDRLIAAHWVAENSDLHITPQNHYQFITLAKQAKEFLTEQSMGSWHFEKVALFLDRLTLETLSMPLVEKTIDICKHTLIEAQLSLADVKGVVLVGGATRMPFLQDRLEKFFKQTPLTNLNPDEVVAIGAARQAHALTHGSETLLLDLTPLSLGLETMGGLVEKIIPRNTPIPCRVVQEFTTYQDGQRHMKIHVVQGEREKVSDCRSLGEFILSDIPSMPSGMPRIQVTFSLDVNGLLTVEAKEKSAEQAHHITIQPSRELTEELMITMLKESYEHGTQDIQDRLFLQKKLQAQQFSDMMGKIVESEHGKEIKTIKASLDDAIMHAKGREEIEVAFQKASADVEALLGRNRINQD